jgi:valyl-tRNA synthetase
VFSQIHGSEDGPVELGTTDLWIRSRLRATIEAAHSGFASYRLDVVIQTLYDFAWHEFCDWYLELTKAVLTDPHADPAKKRGAERTLADVLGAVLKLLHPLMPFVTEELWLELAARRNQASETIVLERYPEVAEFPVDSAAEAEVAWVKGFVSAVRQIRADTNLPRSAKLAVLVADATEQDGERVLRHAGHLRKLAGLERIDLVPPGMTVKGAATALLGTSRLLVPLVDLIDVGAERERLGKQLARAREDLEKVQQKLANQSFVANAPAEIVTKENARVAELTQRAARLDEQLARLADLA